MKASTSNKLSRISIVKSAQHQSLIDILNKKMVGPLSSSDIVTITTSIQTLADTNTLINSKIESISQLLGIVFNIDGTISTQNYTAHTHSYSDVSIEDTADATGLTNTNTKTTQGVV